MYDCHVHSNFSIDGKMSLDDAFQTAIQKGLAGIAITEHLDYDFPEPEEFITDFDKYFRVIEPLTHKYKNDLKILKAVELGYQPQVIKDNDEAALKWPFDYILSSVHVVNHEDPYQESFYEGRTQNEACVLYLTKILESIRNFSNFDVLGHIDYVRRFLPSEEKLVNYKDYKDIIDEILKELISKDKGIEFNTGGFRYKTNPPLTDINIYRRYKELGGEKVCLGSDAHSTGCVADGFQEASTLLKNSGFKYLVHFENRKAVFDKI